MIQYHWKGRRYNVTSQTYNDYVDLHPIYNDKVTINHTMSDDERYYKESFNGTLKFVRDDYSWIMDTVSGVTRFNTIYELELWTQTQKVTTLKFVITDCEVDEDNGIISVKPKPKTRYDDVLNGLDREFNLIKLNPAVNDLRWCRRAILQVYIPGESTVTNYIGTMHWEQEIALDSPEDDYDVLAHTYFFGECDAYRTVTITGVDEDVNGVYVGRIGEWHNTFSSILYPIEDNGYHIEMSIYTYGNLYVRQVIIVNNYTQATPYYYRLMSQAYPSDTVSNQQMLDGYDDTPMQVYCSYTTQRIFARVLCNVDSIAGIPTQALPLSDIVADNKNYKKAMPFTSSISDYSIALIDSPTEWGQYKDNYYYLPPNPSTPDRYQPLAQSEWDRISYWFDNNSAFNDANARQIAVLHHAYPLWSAIKVLLAQIAPDLSFNETTSYSEFLFDYNNATHPLVQDVIHLFITPKSNILAGDYKVPAYKAPITLKQILDMLKSVYQCYWYVDSSNRFRIEHISWFMNGGTYGNPSQTISYDLITLKNSRNMKAWAFDKNKYTFDKPNMPATYTFAWMDEVTQEFKGYQMEMISQLVEKGKNKEITVNKFTSDIDFVTITPDDISKDGFMLLGATTTKEGSFELPFYPLRIEGTTTLNYLQNGFLAYIYLEKNKIWLSNMPAPTVQYADGSSQSVYTQSRMKQQDVVVPMTSPIFDPITLIKTGIGKGEIQDIEINIASLTAKAKLKYDTQ